ncbi:MAG: hypothetical protein ABR514_05420 [Chthoniobacterales bacterium]
MKRNKTLASAIALLWFTGGVNFGADRPDVSRIIDKTAAESILGEAVRPASPRSMDGADGYYSKCNYYALKPGKALIIRLRQAAPGSADPQQELELIRASTGASKPLSGLGDRAEYSHGAESNLPAHGLILYVVKGNNLITVGINGSDDDSLALEKARTVAQKILGQL